MRRFLVLIAALLLVPAASARTSVDRPVAIVVAETANEVYAVSMGPHGGHILKRVSIVDPLTVAAPLHGPAVVVSPSTGTVTLLAWHSLRRVKTFHGFRDPQIAAIAPGDRYAYVADGGSGSISVIDLTATRIVDRVHVGLQAHHMSFSPNGRRLWIALGETATTIVRLDTSDLRKPRVVGRFHPRYGAHDVKFAPDGKTVWITSPSQPYVSGYSVGGRLLWTAGAGRPPGHVAFSGADALVTTGYGSSLAAFQWRSPSRAPRTVGLPYGSFNLATYGGFAVTTSLFTGQVTELRVRNLHRLWTVKVAPAARYVAISLWPSG